MPDALTALISVVAGAVGGMLSYLGIRRTTRHRTRGARRRHAVQNATKEYDALRCEGKKPALAELIHYHYRLLEWLDSGSGRFSNHADIDAEREEVAEAQPHRKSIQPKGD